MMQLAKEALFLFVAFALGAAKYEKLTPFFRLLFVQAILAVICYLSARYVLNVQRLVLPPAYRSNQFVFNIYIFLEALILIWAGLKQLNVERWKLAIWPFAIFLICYFIQISSGSFLVFYNYAAAIEGVILFVIYMRIAAKGIMGKTPGKSIQAEVYASLGIILFFSVYVPYIGMIHYLYENHPISNLILYAYIIEFLNVLRYLFLAIGFWLAGRTTSNV